MTPREIAGDLIYSIFRAQDDRRFGQLQDKIERLILEERATIEPLREALKAFEAFYPRCAQLLDGWHADGTAWTEWDESVRKELTMLGAMVREILAAKEGIKKS